MRIEKWIAIIIIIIIIIIIVLYTNQHNIIFIPTKLPDDYIFEFKHNKIFEEIYINVDKNFHVDTSVKQIYIHGILFSAVTDKGIPNVTSTKPINDIRKLVFYLHGNASALDLWGQIAPLYTHNGYDMFILDYRGFGKSKGYIQSQDQLFNDIQIVYDHVRKLYNYQESNIIVIGYSIGTGLASFLASNNNPKHLILNAPYYSLTRLIKEYKPYIPSFLIKFKLETYSYLKKCNLPITIFHGKNDTLIPIEHAIDLHSSKSGNNDCNIVILPNSDHMNINQNEIYQNIISKILNGYQYLQSPENESYI